MCVLGLLDAASGSGKISVVIAGSLGGVMLGIILIGIAVMVISRCAGRESLQSIVEILTNRRGQPVETGIATFEMNSISGADVDELMQTCPGESVGLTTYSGENGDDRTTSSLQS